MFPGQQPPMPQGPGAPGAPAPQRPPMGPGAPGAPPQPGAQGDPAVKNALMQRIQSLQPQDIAALNTIPPDAMQALCKIIPEVTDMLKPQGQGDGGGGPQPGAGAPPAPDAGGPQPGAPQGGSMPPRRPVTQLGQM